MDMWRKQVKFIGLLYPENIYRALWKQPKKPPRVVVVKQVDLEDPEQHSLAKQECTLLVKLHRHRPADGVQTPAPLERQGTVGDIGTPDASDNDDVGQQEKIDANATASMDLVSFGKFAQDLETDDSLTTQMLHDIYKEEAKLVQGIPLKHHSVPFDADLNRYADIIPYVHSRVKLSKLEGEDYSDYINASFVDTHLSGTSVKYISASAPPPSAFSHFWRMVWEQNCGLVVMLTQEVESQKRKAHKYWPDTNESIMEFGYMSVALLEEDNATQSVIVRKFLVTNNKENSPPRAVTQVQFTAWPDYGKPSSAPHLLPLFSWYRHHRAQATGPVLVHCSAGVGRSGTFIALDSLLDHLAVAAAPLIKQQQDVTVVAREISVNIEEVVLEMRKCRNYMVQSPEQFKFLFVFLLFALQNGHFVPPLLATAQGSPPGVTATATCPIVDYFGSFESQGSVGDEDAAEEQGGSRKLNIVLEYCGGGSMAEILQAILELTNDGLPERIIATVLKGVLEGLAFIHKQGVIHRDIKAANVLLTEAGLVKLADFGTAALASELSGETKSQHTAAIAGSPYWMAPEVCREEAYNTAADIWSVGITAMELVMGEPPLADQHPMSALMMIANADQPPPALPSGPLFSAEFQDFISSCLQADADTRPSAVDLLQSSFIQNNAGSAEELQEVLVMCMEDPDYADSYSLESLEEQLAQLTEEDEEDEDEEEANEELDAPAQEHTEGQIYEPANPAASKVATETGQPSGGEGFFRSVTGSDRSSALNGSGNGTFLAGIEVVASLVHSLADKNKISQQKLADKIQRRRDWLQAFRNKFPL